MASVTVTNELARVVGLVAAEHLGAAVRVDWHEGAPEHLWLVTALDAGAEGGDVVYVVDDERGHWAPARVEDLALAHGDAPRRG